MRKQILLILFFLINISAFKAQSISPFTKSILEVSNIHENEGLANINIPIAELSIKDYTLDINASYNSKGVKINFESGEIGQNWDLSHKGVITRDIIGEADERKVKVTKSPYYGFFQDGSAYIKCYNLAKKENIGLLYNLPLIKSNIDVYFNNPNQVNGYVGSKPTKFIYSDYNTLKIVDTSFDIFTVIIPGKSTFKFYFDLEGKIQSDSDENYKIDYDLDNYSYFKSFTLIDEQGVKFVFNNMETVKQYSEVDLAVNVKKTQIPPKVVSIYIPGNSSIPYCDPNDPSLQYYYDKIPVSWYLSKIENKYGEAINYNYENKKVLSLDLTKVLESSFGGADSDVFSAHINETPVIKSINNNTSSLVYNYDGVRKDFFNFNNPNHTSIERLSSISSFYGNEKKRTVIFNSDYIVSNQAAGMALNDEELAVYRRLFLKRIAFLDPKDSIIDNYVFEYNNPQLLPHRQSYKKDLWGYFRNNPETVTFTLNTDGVNRTITNRANAPKVYTYMNNGLNNIDHNYFSFYKRGGNYTETNECYRAGLIGIGGNNFLVGPCPEIDKTPILSDLSLGLLTSIRNQGSKISFDYDLNYFSYYNIKREGPGARVKTVKTNDGIKDMYTDYIYGENEDGIGYIDELSPVGYYSKYTLTNTNGVTGWRKGPIDNMMNNTILYKTVKSIQKDNTGTNKGYTINTYSLFDTVNNDNIMIDGLTYQSNRKNTYMVTPIQYPGTNDAKYINDLSSTPYSIPETDLSKVNGKLIKREVYNNVNYLIEKTEFDYRLKWKELNSIYIWDTESYIDQTKPKGGGVRRFYLFNYLPKKVETTSFFSNGNIKNTKTYLYNSENKISEINEQTGTDYEKKQIKYMYEGSTAEGNKLKSQNRLNEIEESAISNSDGGMTKIKNTYQEFAISNNLNVIKNVKEEKSIDGTNYFGNEEITLLGAKGNIIERKLNNSLYVTTIWGYNQTKPIAEIQGARYSEIMTLFGLDANSSNSYLQLDIVQKSNSDIDDSSEALLINSLNSFKSTLSKYSVTTYTYDPLIGIKSVTPASGIRELSFYDSAGRLKEIRDSNSNIVKEFKYNVNDLLKYYNSTTNQSFTRNNCGPGTLPEPSLYIVPEGKYTSTLSQADADQKAKSDISANGQNYVNINGVCKPYVCTITPTHLADIYYSSFQETAFGHIKVILSFPITGYNGSTPNWSNGVFIGTLDSLCRPTSYKNFDVSSNGGGWAVSLGPAGDVTVRSTGGSSGSSATLYFEYDKN